MTVATANAPTLQPPLIAVKLVPGHEEDEALLRRTDTPAAGWVKRVYVDGTKLRADFGEVPDDVAALINRRAYRKISAELYTEFADQGQFYGLVLRRVAMLGGEVPQVKTLADIPHVANGEVKGVEIFATGEQRGRVWTVADLHQIADNFARLSSAGHTNYSDSGATYQSILVFHEVRTMKRFQATPAQLRERASKFSPKAKATLQLFADAPPPAPDAAAAPPEAASRDGMITLLTEWGWDPSIFDAIKDDNVLAEMVRMTKSLMGTSAEPAPAAAPQPGATMSATPPIAPAPAPAPAAPTGIPSGQPSSVTLKYGEQNVPLADILNPLIQAALKPLQDQLASAQGNISTFQRDTKKSSIEAFCDRMAKDGKVIPALRESIVARLQRADAVQKFADGRTELDLQMAEIEAGPCLLKFAEVARGGKKAPGSADADVAAIEQHFEQFADDFERYGMTKEKRVAAFGAAKKLQPKLTAEKYLYPSGQATA